MSRVPGPATTPERHMAAIRLRHRPVKSDLPHDICWTCQTYSPCDVGDLLAELKEAREKYERLLHTHDEVTLPELYEATEKLAAVEKAYQSHGYSTALGFLDAVGLILYPEGE